MTSNKYAIHIPASTVKFMALREPVMGMDKNPENKKYTIRVEVDGSTKEGQELKAKLLDINPNRVNEKAASKSGNFVVALSSKFAPTVLDAEGQTLNHEDIPNLGRGGLATARIEAIVDESRANKALKVKGALYLGLVQLLDVSIGESGNSSALEDRIKALTNAG